jgi:hypothetical protein
MLAADISENSEVFSRQNSSGFFVLVGGKRSAFYFASLSSAVGSSVECATIEVAPSSRMSANGSLFILGFLQFGALLSTSSSAVMLLNKMSRRFC